MRQRAVYLMAMQLLLQLLALLLLSFQCSQMLLQLPLLLSLRRISLCVQVCHDLGMRILLTLHKHPLPQLTLVLGLP